MLWRALGDVKEGFYIDLGAQDPLVDSVSLAFYKSGWRGIHVEPTPQYADMLRRQRPDETVVQAAVASFEGMLTFYQIPGGGLSTGSTEIAENHRRNGIKVDEISVKAVTLASVFELASGREVHWLKIDVEGFEEEALVGWADHPARPWIIIVESTLPLTQIDVSSQWDQLILRRGYSEVYFDGLNRFYVSDHHPELKAAFQTPPNVFDRFQLNGTASTSLHHLVEARGQEKIASLSHEVIDRDLQLKIARIEAERRHNNTSGFKRAFAGKVRRLKAELKSQADVAAQHVADLKGQQDALSRDLEARENANQQLVESLREDHNRRQNAFAMKIEQLQQQLFAAHQAAGQVAREQAVRQQALMKNLAEARRNYEDQVRISNAYSDQLSRTNATVTMFRERLRAAKAELAEAQQAVTASTELFNSNIAALAKLNNNRIAAMGDALSTATDRFTDAISQKEDALFRAIEAVRLTESEAEAKNRVMASELQFYQQRYWQFRIMVEELMKNPASVRSVNASDEGLLRSRPTSYGTSAQHDVGMTTHLEQNYLVPVFMSASERNFEQMDENACVEAAELLALQDEAFVKAAYCHVLARVPDPEGLKHYLARFRGGESKLGILASMRYSAEGRNKKLTLPGLERSLKPLRWQYLPVIGRIFRVIYNSMANTGLQRQLRVLGNEVWRARGEAAWNAGAINKALQNATETAARLNAIEAQFVKIKTATSLQAETFDAMLQANSVALGRSNDLEADIFSVRAEMTTRLDNIETCITGMRADSLNQTEVLTEVIAGLLTSPRHTPEHAVRLGTKQPGYRLPSKERENDSEDSGAISLLKSGVALEAQTPKQTIATLADLIAKSAEAETFQKRQ